MRTGNHVPGARHQSWGGAASGTAVKCAKLTKAGAGALEGHLAALREMVEAARSVSTDTAPSR